MVRYRPYCVLFTMYILLLLTVDFFPRTVIPFWRITTHVWHVTVAARGIIAMQRLSRQSSRRHTSVDDDEQNQNVYDTVKSLPVGMVRGSVSGRPEFQRFLSVSDEERRGEKGKSRSRFTSRLSGTDESVFVSKPTSRDVRKWMIKPANKDVSLCAVTCESNILKCGDGIIMVIDMFRPSYAITLDELWLNEQNSRVLVFYLMKWERTWMLSWMYCIQGWDTWLFKSYYRSKHM